MKFCVFIFLIIFEATLSQQNPLKANYTRELLRQAKISELMSYQAHENYACGSFYEQACNNWRKSYPATYDNPKTSHLGQIHKLYLSKCSELLKNYKGFDDNYALVRKFYTSCVNKRQIEKFGIAPILRAYNFPTDWPMNQDFEWYQTEYDWLKVAADIRRELGLNLFIGLELKAPGTGLYENVKRIHVGRPKLPLAKRIYLNSAYETELENYKQKIVENLQRNFGNMSETWSWQVAEEVLSVEKALAKGFADDKKVKRNQTVEVAQEQAVAQLKAKYGKYVDLSRYLNLVLNRTINEQVFEESSVYLNNLYDVIQTTNKLTLANYTIYRTLEHMGFISELTQSDDYEIKCAERTVKHFPQHVASLFANEFKTYAGDETGTLINKIFNDVKRALEIKFGKLKNFDWMSEQVRPQATAHFGHISFPVPDVQALENYFSNVAQNIKIDQYYENLMHIWKFETEQELKTTSFGQLEPDLTVSRNLPFYSAEENEIIIPVEFVQTHFVFDAEYPQAINYGTLGVLLAQQLLQGLLSSQKWWDNATMVAFKTRQDCFEQQIKDYKFKNKRIDDEQSLLKFIIDVSAVEIAFAAYSDWLKQQGKEIVKMENLSSQFDYSKERLFFLSFGQLYCADYFLDAFSMFVELPERLIVNGALSNFVKFAEIFNCGMNTRMNPKNKCTIF